MINRTFFIHGNTFFIYGFREVISSFVIGIGMAMTTGALSFPMGYLFNGNTSRAPLIIGVTGSLGLAYFMLWFIYRVDQESIQFYPRLRVCLLIYIAIYFVSYMVTRKLYSKMNERQQY